jgi:pimeloyl-ACP methyl ester carboxylesterase
MKTQLVQAELAARARRNAERREVTISGVRTAYWFYAATKGSKSPATLVMIHGYRGNHHGLEAIAGALENINVVIPDLPGFGESEAFTTTHSIQNYAEWLHKFLVSLKLAKKPHLLGHSFGSIVVSAEAARFDDIATLILENPVAAPALAGPKAFTTALAKSFFWLAGALPERTGISLLKGFAMVRGMSVLMAKTNNRQLRKWIHQQHDENFNDFASRRVALEGYVASVSNCVGDFAKDFSVPVLLLAGKRDDITTVAQQRELAERIGSTRRQLEVFNGVGHLTHYEIPEKIADHISAWVIAND